MSEEKPGGAPEEVDTSEVHYLRRQVKAQKGELKRLRDRLDELAHLERSTERVFSSEIPDGVLPSGKAGSKKRAIVHAIWSDWHVEENVVASHVNGLNSYSLDIAYERVRRLVEGVLWKMQMHAGVYHLDGMHLHLGGDLLTGWIHDELIETSNISPIETLNWLYSVLVEALNRMAKEAPVPRIVIVCSPGNHGRMTEKRRSANRAATSFEWLLYQRLAEHYKDHAKINIWAPQSTWIYAHAYDAVYRFGHGDDINYRGGVGGITIPINKALARLDKGRPADVTCMGHFHTLTFDDRLIVNGSLIGPTPYSLPFGYEPPRQAYWIHVDGRGPTDFSGIWVRDKGEQIVTRRESPSEAQWERTGIVRPPPLEAFRPDYSKVSSK